MDQFNIVFWEVDQAIYLDVNLLKYELVPINFSELVILFMNTNKRRDLSTFYQH